MSKTLRLWLLVSVLSVICSLSDFAKGGLPLLQSLSQDPAVPMISLPTQFSSRRVSFGQGFNKSVEIANLRGPGCIRHIWFLRGKDRRIEINIDDAEMSQINLPIKSFFGVMHDLDPYFIDCAAYTVLPNPAPGIEGTPGYNLWLPIPFKKSCRIVIHSSGLSEAVGMIDWHKYDESTSLTPYRLHTDYRKYTPAPERGGFVELASVGGQGFVAGVVVGYIQRNKQDMVFHTGGMTLLLDGETDPHAIRGNNVEDDFGFTWGFNDRQSRWIGCPWHENRGRNDQDGVFYRFFGPDPIAFKSSVVFRTGCRGDDMESVVYSYQVEEAKPIQINTPKEWRVTGLFMGGNNWEEFKKSKYIGPKLEISEWPVEPDHNYPSREKPKIVEETIESDHGWIDLQNTFFARDHTMTPLTMLHRIAYARTTIVSDINRSAVVRVAVDDWAVLWFNGEKVATLKHENGLESAKIHVKLKKGENELLVKTNNTKAFPNNALWVINCSIE